MNLYKRQETREAPYYARFQVRGKAYLWSTKTNDLAVAKKRAKEYHGAIVAREYGLASTMRERSSVPTFEELYEEYRKMPAPDMKTKKRNIAAMVQVARAAGLGDHDRIDRLGAQAGVDWQRHCQRADSGISNVSCNTILRMAKSLFSARAMMGYKLDMPKAAIFDFMRVLPLPEAKRLPEVPTDAAMALAHERLPANPPLYRAFLLAAYAGCRSGEIIAAQQSWITDTPDGPVLTIGGQGPFVTKSKDYRVVRLDKAVAATLRAGGGPGIVGGAVSEIVQRQLVTALQTLGFPRKAVQSCRRWYGTQLAARDGIWAAKAALGHSSVTVTESFYARATSLAAPLGPVASAPSAGAAPGA